MFKKVLFLVYVLTLPSAICFSQGNILDKKISLHIQNKQITEILGLIEKKGEFTFSFNNSIFDNDKRLSVSYQNKSLNDVLIQLLGNQFEWFLYNNQILISQKKTSNQPTKHNITQKPSPNKRVIDSIHIYIHDTIHTKVFDTVVFKKIDHIIINDTIRITQQISEKVPSAFWQLSLLYSQFIKTFTIFDYKKKYTDIKNFIDNSESEWSGNEAGLALEYTKKKIRFRTGLLLTNISQNVSYTFEKNYIDERSFYIDSTKIWQYNTILYYYKFKDGDTVKIPIIDSSSIYKSFSHNKQVSERRKTFGTNSIRLVQIPLSIGFPITLNPRNSITTYYTTRLYILTQSQGFTYNSIRQDIDSLQSTNVSQYFVSTSLSFQYEHALNKQSTLFIEPTFNQFINPLFSDKRVVNQRLFQCSIAFGIKTILFSK